MKDIWRLAQNINIYHCHIYKEANCLAKIYILVILIQIFDGRNFLKMLENLFLKNLINILLIVFVEFVIRGQILKKKQM